MTYINYLEPWVLMVCHAPRELQRRPYSYPHTVPANAALQLTGSCEGICPAFRHLTDVYPGLVCWAIL